MCSIDMLQKAEKKWLCKIGSFCGGNDFASALVSRRLYANAGFIVSGCNSALSDRWVGIKFEVAVNPSVKKATYLHDFEKGGRGVVTPGYDNEEKTSGFLVWNGLPLDTKVRISAGFCVAGVVVSLLNPHCDDTCALKGADIGPTHLAHLQDGGLCRTHPVLVETGPPVPRRASLVTTYRAGDGVHF